MSLLTACGTVDDVPIEEEPRPPTGPEPTTIWAPAGAEDPAVFPGGVRVGDAKADSAVVAGRTTEASVSVHLALGTEDGWEELDAIVDVASTDGVAEVELTGLEPDHVYAVALVSADGTLRSRVSRFRTALDTRGRRVVRFGATSCLGGNEPWPSLSHAAAQRLDFFLFGGDTIYADWGFNQFNYEAKWEQANSVPGLADLAASTSVIATWDDHEVNNNWSWTTPGIEDLYEEALTAFRRGMPRRIGPGGSGIWRSLSWGETLDVFVLDGRGERRDGAYVSAEQLTWLKEALSASSARFKIILNSVPIIDFTGTLVGEVQAEDRWQGYPAQRSELVAHIENEGIGGVLFVSGDFHIGGAATISPAEAPGANIVEVLAGPGGSPINMFADLIEPDGERLLSIIKVWNYTLFEADPDTGVVRISWIGDDASVLDAIELTL